MSQIIRESPQLPILAYTRKLLNSILPGDDEFVAFVIDFYSETAKKFGSGQTRTEKTNLLLLNENPSEICEHLKQAFPDRYRKIEEGQIKKQIAKTMAIAVSTTEKNTWSIRFNGEFGALCWNDVQRVIETLNSMLEPNQAESQIVLTEVNTGSIELVIVSTMDSFQKIKTKLDKNRQIGVLSIIGIEKHTYKPSLWNRLFRYDHKRTVDESLIDAYFLQNYFIITKSEAQATQQLELAQKEYKLLREVHKKVLSQKPSIEKIAYNVAVLGMSGSGKTTIINKITELPLAPPPKFRETSYAIHERTISIEHDEDGHWRKEHTLRFHEWGGELTTNAVLDMNDIAIKSGFRAILLVVDIGIPRAEHSPQAIDKMRIESQLNAFNRTYIDFLLNVKICGKLHSFVLFINKCDLLEGTQRDIVLDAKKLFAPLIDSIRTVLAMNASADFSIIAGSAFTDMGLIQLTSHLVSPFAPQATETATTTELPKTSDTSPNRLGSEGNWQDRMADVIPEIHEGAEAEHAKRGG